LQGKAPRAFNDAGLVRCDALRRTDSIARLMAAAVTMIAGRKAARG